MASTNTNRIGIDTSYQDFATSLLPLYVGPSVKVQIGIEGPEYELSKRLLCKQSSYFAATFEGEFQEGQHQSTILSTEEDDFVTQRSFEMLIQWLYLGRVVSKEPTPTENITAAIDFLRLADMCDVHGMESLMAEQIKAIILANPAPTSDTMGGRDPNTNTYVLLGKHFTSAVLLPKGHPVRKVLATTAVEGFIRRNKHKYLDEMCNSPDFALDLLLEVKETMKTVGSGKLSFKDPITGEILPFVTSSA